MTDKFLNARALAKRWGVTPQTLKNWRYRKGGPRYMKLGPGKKCKVLYNMKDILEHEKQKLVLP